MGNRPRAPIGPFDFPILSVKSIGITKPTVVQSEICASRRRVRLMADPGDRSFVGYKQRCVQRPAACWVCRCDGRRPPGSMIFPAIRPLLCGTWWESPLKTKPGNAYRNRGCRGHKATARERRRNAASDRCHQTVHALVIEWDILPHHCAHRRALSAFPARIELLTTARELPYHHC